MQFNLIKGDLTSFNWLDCYEKVDGTLVPPDGPDEWPKNYSRRQWLVFYRINEMSLTGGGVIDGRGQKWWNLPCKPHKVYIYKHIYRD